MTPATEKAVEGSADLSLVFIEEIRTRKVRYAPYPGFRLAFAVPVNRNQYFRVLGAPGKLSAEFQPSALRSLVIRSSTPA